MWCDSMQCDTMRCNSMQCGVTWCDVMQFDVVLSGVTWWDRPWWVRSWIQDSRIEINRQEMCQESRGRVYVHAGLGEDTISYHIQVILIQSQHWLKSSRDFNTIRPTITWFKIEPRLKITELALQYAVMRWCSGQGIELKALLFVQLGYFCATELCHSVVEAHDAQRLQ